MCPEIFPKMVTWDTPVSYWPMFSPVSIVTVPKVCANVNLPQSPPCFLSDEEIDKADYNGLPFRDLNCIAVATSYKLIFSSNRLLKLIM